MTTFSSVNLIFRAQLHEVGPTGDSSVSIMLFEHPVEKFPSVSPAFPFREGLFSPSALYFLLFSFTSLDKFFHHGLEMILHSPQVGPLSSFHHPSGIWSSPYESCRILVATPYQGSLPLVMSGSAQPSLHGDYSALCFDSGYSAFLLLAHCAGDPFKSWVLNSSLSIMRSLSLPDETSPLYAPDPCHP